MVEKQPPYISVSRITLLILVCFFLSGITGLVYEVLWTRMIVKVIGSAPFAVGIVLTVFMGGLGLGSFLASRHIDKIEKPTKLIKIYGLLELITGLYALAIPVMLAAFRPVYAIVYNRLFNHFILYNLLTFAGCSALLLLPVCCMGATLPLLCRFYVTSLSRLGTNSGRLYGLNTIGAAAGAVLSGFWLISLLGVWGTLISAVIVNVIIGLVCISVGHKIEKQPFRAAGPEKSPQKFPEQTTAPRGYPAAVKSSLVIFAVSGFCAMAYEVIWTRLLGLIVGPTTYSFTIVLVTFILGLALGSMLFGWLGDKTGKAVWLLICTQIIAAIFALGVSHILGVSQLFFAKLIFTFESQFAMLNLSKAVILFGFMIFPTLCLGASFPLVGKIYTPSISKVGSSIGLAYTINTIGAVLGAFCADFVLIPLAGKEKSLGMVIGLQLFVALGAAIIITGRKNVIRLISLAVPAAAGLVLCFYFPHWDRLLLAEGRYNRFEQIGIDLDSVGWWESLFNGPQILTRYHERELVYYGDGIGGFTTVLKYASPLGNIAYSLINSGKPDASSYGDMRTQTLLAHFPMVFHRNPKTVMVLGLASGITAGEVLCYPIDRLDIVEINNQAVAASRFFTPWNNNVLSNPRTRLIIQDGRAHLELTEQSYDVIISEPSNPWMAGLASLFTRDFFELAKNRLNPNGIFVQWFHSYQMDWETFSLLGRTFAQVFPNSILVQATPTEAQSADYLFVGFKNEEGLNVENCRLKLSSVKRSKNINLSDPKLLYVLVVSEALPKLFGDGPVNTDNQPRLEFAAPRLMYHLIDTTISETIRNKKWFSTETREMIRRIATDVDAQIEVARYSLSVYSPFDNMVNLHKAAAAQKDRFFKLMEAYCAKNPIEYSVFNNNEELKQKCLSVQIEVLRNNIENMPDKTLSYLYLGNLYHMRHMLNEAEAVLSKALQLNPYDTEVRFNLGAVLHSENKFDEAVKQYLEVLRTRPSHARANYNLGLILRSQGKNDEAISYLLRAVQADPESAEANHELAALLAVQGKFEQAFEYYNKALQIRPDFISAHYNLGNLLQTWGRLDEAMKEYRKVLQIKPDDAETHYRLGEVLQSRGEFAEAAVHYSYLLRTEPNNADVHNNLGIVLGAQNKFDEAIMHFRKVLELEPDNAEAYNNLGIALDLAGRFDEAVDCYRQAIRLKPDWPLPMNGLAKILAAHPQPNKRNADEAVKLAEQAAKLTGYQNAVVLDTLAASYAATGRFNEAVTAAESALKLAAAQQDDNLTDKIRKQLEAYKKGQISLR